VKSHWDGEPSAEYRAQCAEFMRQIFERFPLLKNATSPRALPRVDGSWVINARSAFAELAASGLKLRCPAESPAGLAGPFRGVGSCLEPLCGEGDLRWFDPSLPAQDGDMVLVEMTPETLQGIVDRGASDSNWLAMYGHTPNPLVVKILRAIGNEYHLLTNGSLLPLGDNRILGVCRYIRPAAPAANQIGQNAAFKSYGTSGTGSSTVAASFASPTLIGSVTVPAQIFDSTVVLTFVTNMGVTAGSAGGAGIWAYIDTAVNAFYDASASNARCYQATAGLFASNNVSIEETFSQPAGSSVTYNVYAARGGGGTGAAANYAGWTLKAEVMFR
jgi:hypothetical protein